MKNPYLEALMRHYPHVSKRCYPEFPRFDRENDYAEVRAIYVRSYAWAIPNEKAIHTILSLGPVVEIGAGGGYWASLIKQEGGDIIAFDNWSDHKHSELKQDKHFDVLTGDADVARQHPDRTLFLCWPRTDAALLALHTYAEAGGKRIVYVGEGWGGCCASEDFFGELDGWGFEPQKKTVQIPVWEGMRDYLTVYER